MRVGRKLVSVPCTGKSARDNGTETESEKDARRADRAGRADMAGRADRRAVGRAEKRV
ncbi:hypothetical protein AGMMS49593_10500 [Endomicrobiia bacterium]|nr:hypothetical protein AGMMS49593_10500 [Endomicrobiia bacterium]